MKAALKEVADSVVLFIVVLAISGGEVLDDFGDISFAYFYGEVNVVCHEAEGEDFVFEFFLTFL